MSTVEFCRRFHLCVTLLLLAAIDTAAFGQTQTIWVETDISTESMEVILPAGVRMQNDAFEIGLDEMFLDSLRRGDKHFGGAIADGSIAGVCPSPGNCCTGHGGLGCDDFACCSFICDIDDWCCTISWDAECAGLAISACDSSVCGPGGCGPGAGNCCEGNGTPGCEDVSCCKSVCAQDAFCCDTEWDFECANAAAGICGSLCGEDACANAAGLCCQVHPSNGCENATCCNKVCAQNPSCCTDGWSPDCVDAAAQLCGCTAPDPVACVPDDGDCCTSNFDPGCNNDCCCEIVCTADDFCCVEVWDSICGDLAQELCPGVCQEIGLCPGEGACFSANGNGGCEDEYCCNTVCSIDPTCCTSTWDAGCAALAEDFCTCTEDPGPTCPVAPEGDCCDGNASPGCEDDACCGTVCEVDTFCCDSIWDGFCAELAIELCDCPSCGDGNIFYLNPPVSWIDPAQPHPPGDPSTIQGQLLFSVTTPPTAASDGCWSICESLVNPKLHTDNGGPGILNTNLTETNQTTLTLVRPINPGEYCRITYTSYTGSTVAPGLFQALPGDVNGDGIPQSIDVLHLIDEFDFPGTLPLIRSDIDRDGEVQPEDLLRLMDLLNGGGSYDAWYGVTIDTSASCLSD